MLNFNIFRLENFLNQKRAGAAHEQRDNRARKGVSFPSTGGYIQASPAVVNGVVYVGCADHKLYAFDATTLAKLWSATTDDNIYSDPAMADGMVLCELV